VRDAEFQDRIVREARALLASAEDRSSQHDLSLDLLG